MKLNDKAKLAASPIRHLGFVLIGLISRPFDDSLYLYILHKRVSQIRNLAAIMLAI